MKRELPAWQTALIGCSILMFSMGVGRFAFTPLLPLMQEEGLLDVSNGGVLASLHFFGYAMGAFFAVWLRSSPSSTLVVSLALIGLATVAMGTSSSFLVWAVARWIAGVCSALVLVVVSTQFIKRLAEIDRLDLQGWVFAGVGGGTALVGIVTLPIMLSGSAASLGWQLFGYATLLVSVVLYALQGTLSFERPPVAGATEMAPSPIAWQMVLPYGAMGAGYIIPATYLPIMAKATVATPLAFGWAWPVFGAAAALSTILSARLYRDFSNRQIWIASQVIMAFGLVLPVLSGHLSAVAAAGVCVGGTFMVITMAGIKEAHRVAGKHDAQPLIAAMTTAFAIGQIIGPALAGWAFAATGSFSFPLLLACFILLATLLPMMMQSTIPDDQTSKV